MRATRMGANDPAAPAGDAVRPAEPPMSVTVLTAPQLQELVGRAVAPLRQEIAELRAAQRAEAVTISEAARRLRVSTRTIQRRLQDGSLPSIRVGHARRVQLSAVLHPEPEIAALALSPREG